MNNELKLLIISNFKFYYRSKRFQILLPLSLAISYINAILVLLRILHKPADPYTFLDATLSYYLPLFIVIAGLFGGDLISKDFSREGLFTLSQPMKRDLIFTARFLSALISSIIAVIVFLLGVISSTYILYGYLVGNFGLIIAFSILGMTSLLAFTSLFSTLSKNPSVSITISILILLIIFPIIEDIMTNLQLEPWFLIIYGLTVIANVAEPHYPPHIIQIVSSNGIEKSYNVTIAESIAILVGYLIFSLIISMIIYRIRQLAEV
ncbi:ABC transporter permease [Acidianus manzaensis]|uniref:ABC transporter permease n=1 Tax=Acidianus manzaensis TaxID=282676 RepID=A0A1W6K2Y1_9CREN|nr:ABC transporter permease subunit [Acidianus manzaensis]ARM76850.1 hypothetical protein B6F84_13025 [Acidianus manzaensis]